MSVEYKNQYFKISFQFLYVYIRAHYGVFLSSASTGLGSLDCTNLNLSSRNYNL